MGKKGSWLSTLKRVFTPHSKEKLVNNGSEKKGVKEKKKWGLGRLRYGDSHSFIPLCREPSSVEKILGDAEREHQRPHALHSREHQRPHSLPPREQQQQTHSLPSTVHQQTHSLPSSVHQQTHGLPSSVHQHKSQFNATPNYHHIAAIKIQTVYRGYMARRSFRALKGLVRLQGVVRGQSVKRQTMHAMKCMQLHVRVQQQIHSRRIQMMENQALQRHNLHKIDKDLESSVGKGTITQLSETEQEWDDSILTKEEIDARMQKKVAAVIKRERALAYTYSHQLWKGTPKSAHAALMEIRSGGFPWWWNWLERQLPAYVQEDPTAHAKNNVTPPKHNVETNVGPQTNSHKQPKFGLEIVEIGTPRSTKSFSTPKAKHMPSPASRVPQRDSPTPINHMKTKARGDEFSMVVTPRDDESLTSCPPFSVPNYMVSTVSAKAKVRAYSNPKERSAAATPRHYSKKRLSFPLTQSIGSLRWNKGSLFSGKDSSSQRITEHSVGNLSVDSTLSLPAGVGRKPFKFK